MTWELLLAVLVSVLAVLALARSRRWLFLGSRSEPLSTLSVSRKHEKRKKAALDAATAVLR